MWVSSFSCYSDDLNELDSLAHDSLWVRKHNTFLLLSVMDELHLLA